MAMRGAHMVWIPIPQGQKSCVCCGTHWGGITLACGHHYCQICEGRGHEEDHECEDRPVSEAFDRLVQDCGACGERHLDWETCADLVRAYAKSINASIVDQFVVDRITGQVRPLEETLPMCDSCLAMRRKKRNGGPTEGICNNCGANLIPFSVRQRQGLA